MKTTLLAIFASTSFALLAQSNPLPLVESPWTVSKRAAHESVWESVSLVTNEVNGEMEVSAQKHRFTEVASGLNYFDTGAQEWKATVEQWEAYEDGLVAQFGPHKVIIGPDVNEGNCVDFLGTGGTRLLGNPVAIGIFDPVDEKHAILANVVEAEPQWGDAAHTQVVFPQCFDNLDASIRFTYKKFGFSQEVILGEDFDLPEGFSEWSRIECYTEFDADTVAPGKTTQVLRAEPEFTDETLTWGDFAMGPGKAFALGNGANISSIPVAKSYQVIEGRPVLIEAVEWRDLAPLLAQLQAAHQRERKEKTYVVNKGRKMDKVANRAQLPRLPVDGEAKELAQHTFHDKAVVIDYEILNSSTNSLDLTNATWYVTGPCFVQNLTIRGGAVVKYALTNNASITASNVVCHATNYFPAVFTSASDSGLGESIAAGDCWTTYAGDFALKITNSATLNHVRFTHLKTAVVGDHQVIITLRNTQVVHTETAVKYLNYGTNLIYNALFYDTQTNFFGPLVVRGEHLTLHDVDWLSQTNGTDLFLTNSVLVAITNNAVSFPILTSCSSNATDAGVFTNVGAAKHYLAPGSTNRLAGTANINATLASDLAWKTTYWPTVITTNITGNTTLSTNVARINPANPDRGFAYDPLDYALNMKVTNASSVTLTLTNGVCVAGFNTVAIELSRLGRLESEGTPTNLNRIVRFDTVMEQANTNWTNSLVMEAIRSSGATAAITDRFRFTFFSTFRGSHFSGYGTSRNASFTDCQFYSGSLWTRTPFLYCTNNLFERSILLLDMEGDGPLEINLWNNLFVGGSVETMGNEEGGTIVLKDNAFDQTSLFNGWIDSTDDYNAYQTGYSTWSGSVQPNDVVVSSFTYTNGPLGNYYQLSTNLINRGSQTAIAAGLEHYTTRTGPPSVREGLTQVDIGFHYVATSDGSSLFDTDQDGVPDYLDGSWYQTPDSDNDGVSDLLEEAQNTSTNSADSVLPLRLAKWSFEVLTNNQTGTYSSISNLPPLGSSSPTLASDGILYGNKTVLFGSAGDRLEYREAETNGYANFSLRRGSLMFWFKPEWTNAPGGARLFEVGLPGDTNEGYWSFYLDANTNMIFASYTNSANGGTNMSASGLSLTNGNWNHVVLAWSPTNCALWLNGALAQSNAATVYYPKSQVRAYGASLGNSLDGSNPAQGRFDDFATYNYPLSGSEITNHYYYTRPITYVSSPKLWVMADTSIQIINGLVTNWTSLVNSYVFRQNNPAKQPTVVSNLAAANGHNVVQFDGIDNYLSVASGVPGVTAAEVFLAHRVLRNLNQTNGLWILGRNSSYYPHTNGIIIDSFGTETHAAAPDTFETGVPLRLATLGEFHQYGVAVAPSQWTSRINGLRHFSDRIFHNPGLTAATLGTANEGSSNTNLYYHGEMAEILLFDRIVSEVDRNVVNTYMNYRYRFLTNTPNIPSNFVAKAVSSNQVSLTWEGMETNHSTTYVLERRAGQTGTSIHVTNIVDNVSFFDTGLDANTAYHYRVKAMNAWNESAFVETSTTTSNSTVEIPLSSLKMWLRADAGVIRQTSNSTVVCWQDQMSTNDATQLDTENTVHTGTNQPAYSRVETNSHPVIEFSVTADANGTNDFLRLPLNSFSGPGQSEVFVVIKATITNSSAQGFWDFGTASDHNTQYPDSLGRIVDNFGVNRLYTSNGTNGLNQYHLYQVTSKTNDWKSYINSDLLNYQTNGTPVFPNTPTIGRSGASISYKYFAGKIPEMIVFSPPLTSDQATTVRNYLKNKYNLP